MLDLELDWLWMDLGLGIRLGSWQLCSRCPGLSVSTTQVWQTVIITATRLRTWCVALTPGPTSTSATWWWRTVWRGWSSRTTGAAAMGPAVVPRPVQELPEMVQCVAAMVNYTGCLNKCAMASTAHCLGTPCRLYLWNFNLINSQNLGNVYSNTCEMRRETCGENVVRADLRHCQTTKHCNHKCFRIRCWTTLNQIFPWIILHQSLPLGRGNLKRKKNCEISHFYLLPLHPKKFPRKKGIKFHTLFFLMTSFLTVNCLVDLMGNSTTTCVRWWGRTVASTCTRFQLPSVWTSCTEPSVPRTAGRRTELGSLCVAVMVNSTLVNVNWRNSTVASLSPGQSSSVHQIFLTSCSRSTFSLLELMQNNVQLLLCVSLSHCVVLSVLQDEW